MTAGDIVLQPLSADPKSAAVALHSLSLLEWPRFAHCGIYLTGGQMITATGSGVAMQDAGAIGNIAVPYGWHAWSDIEQILRGYLGRPYDWGAWAIGAFDFALRPLGLDQTLRSLRMTCSALVAVAISLNLPETPRALNRRTVSPDDIARFLGVR